MRQRKDSEGNTTFDTRVHIRDKTGALVAIQGYSAKIEGDRIRFIDNTTGVQYHPDGSPIEGAPVLAPKRAKLGRPLLIDGQSFETQAELEGYIRSLKESAAQSPAPTQKKGPTSATPPRPSAPAPKPAGPVATSVPGLASLGNDPGNTEPALNDPKHPSNAGGSVTGL